VRVADVPGVEGSDLPTGDTRAGFGQPVAFSNDDAEADREEFGDVRWERRSTVVDELKAAAQLVLDLVEDEFVPKRCDIVVRGSFVRWRKEKRKRRWRKKKRMSEGRGRGGGGEANGSSAWLASLRMPS
jgi:hypothetical protein